MGVGRKITIIESTSIGQQPSISQPFGSIKAY